MSRFASFVFVGIGLTFGPLVARAEHEGKVQILLLGDSTTIGSVCRQVDPDGPHLEDVVRVALETEGDLPPSNVINQGRDGEFIRGLLDSGRYEKEISPLPGIDYVFIRYGLNDLGKRENFDENFPKDFAELIGRLKKDFPTAEILPTTIIPYLSAEADDRVLAAIDRSAVAAGLPTFDLYSPYARELTKGHNMLNYRRFAIANIPENKRPLAAPWVKNDAVVIMDNQLDVHFGNLPGWYGDRHPNLAGYQVIGAATAKHLAPKLRAKRQAGK